MYNYYVYMLSCPMKKNILASVIVWAWLILATPSIWLSQSWKKIQDNKKEIAADLSSVQTKKSINYQDSLLDIRIDSLSLNELRYCLTQGINKIRTKQWLAPVKLLDDVNGVAQNYSLYLSENKMDDTITWEDHFDKEGNSVLERVKWAWVSIDTECRWDCKKTWENLASSHMTVQQMIDLWMKSTSHRWNILWKSFDGVWVWHAKWSKNVVLVFVNLVK